MSQQFTIKTRADGTYRRNEYGQVRVVGADAGEEAWVSHVQIDSIRKRQAATEINLGIEEAIAEATANDPVIQAIEAGKEKLAALSVVAELPAGISRTVFAEEIKGERYVPEVGVDHNHDTKVILLIEAGLFDNLEWDLNQTGSNRIQILV